MRYLYSILLVGFLAVTMGCGGQNDEQSSKGEDKGGFGSSVSGMFGQTEEEKSLHQAQSKKIDSLKQKQKEMQKARTEAVQTTNANGEIVQP